MNLNIFFRPLLYLDPGTGSFIIQLLLAGLLGIGLAVKVYWKKIATFFNRNKEESTLDSLDEIDEYGENLDKTSEGIENS